MRFIALILLASVLAAYAPAADEPKIDLKKGITFTGRAEANVVEIRSRVSSILSRTVVKEGAKVRKGDLLVELDDQIYKATLDIATARLAKATGKMQSVAADFARVKAAFDKGAATKDEFKKVEGDQLEAEADIRIAKAELALAQIQLKFTKLTSHIDGYVDRITVTPGNLVLADTTLVVTVVASDPIAVAFDVDERTFLAIRRAKLDGANKPVVEVGLSDEDGFPHKATLDAMGAIVDPKTATVRFRAILANPKDLIAHGMFIRARLTMQPGK